MRRPRRPPVRAAAMAASRQAARDQKEDYDANSCSLSRLTPGEMLAEDLLVTIESIAFHEF